MERINSIIAANTGNKSSIFESKVRGFTKIFNWFLMSQDFSIYEKMVLITIKQYAKGKDKCWPAIKTIAEKARCSDTNVKLAIKSLKRKSMMEVSREKGIKSNVYSKIKI
jgi:hypothetical protein